MFKTHEAFAPLQVPDRLRGIDAQLLADLYDVGINYGRDLGARGVQRVLTIDKPRPIFLTVSCEKDRKMSISTNASYVLADQDCFVLFGTRLDNSMLVVDPKISVEDIRQVIAAADAKFPSNRNPLTGGRTRAVQDSDAPQKKLNIDELLLRHPNGVAFPKGTTPEQVAQNLDRPDEVVFALNDQSPSGFVMRYKKDMIRVSDMLRIAEEVAAEFGLASVKDADTLPDAERKRFEAELFARVSGNPVQRN